MKRVPLGKYAKLKKMSRAEVIHKIMQGELQAQEILENGKKMRYILVEEEMDETSNIFPFPSWVFSHIQKIASVDSIRYCYEGKNDYFIALEEKLLIFNKESAIITIVPVCQEKQCEKR